VIVAHRRPVARDWVPPLALIYSRPSELYYAIVHLGLFPWPDASLRLLTIVRAQLLHRILPQRWLLTCKSSSLPEIGARQPRGCHHHVGGEPAGLRPHAQGGECRM
jgi:hypothetical protein